MAARRASSRTSCRPLNGGAWPSPSAVDHLGGERQFAADDVDVGGRLDLPGEVAAERRRGVAGEEFADLVEPEQVEGVSVHGGEVNRFGFDEGDHARWTPRGAAGFAVRELYGGIRLSVTSGGPRFPGSSRCWRGALNSVGFGLSSGP